MALKTTLKIIETSQNHGPSNGDIECLSVDECAKTLGVSGATIRNWIKTGYLALVARGRVSKDSVENFKTHTAGKEKLNQRANKSKKDSHDHDATVAELFERLREGIENPDSLGDAYEKKLSDSYRNKEGIYYTPTNIVSDLMRIDGDNLADKRFCDPCCGSGNFLVRALDIGFRPENIFGFDTDPVAVEISKRRIYERTGFVSENIKCADFIELSVSAKADTYDYIFTNPPWGKKIDKAQKISIGKVLNAGASLDTCSLFYFACLQALTPNGRLGLLLPEAFFNVLSYEDARISALSYEIERLNHYGKPFKGLLSSAVGIVLSKRVGNLDCTVACQYDNVTFKRDLLSFRNNPKSIFNISCKPEEADVISHIYSLPHFTLKGYGIWALGIVTGNNDRFIESEQRDGLVPVFKGSDITKQGMKPASNFIPGDFSLYQQVAPPHLYSAKRKLIYKFISSNLCFFYDTEGRFIINSANMLIVDDTFPVSMKTICDLFNSDFMNWVFSKLFDTHKVLRGDLELLPIHAQLLKNENFVEAEFLKSINIERTTGGTFRVKRQNNCDI